MSDRCNFSRWLALEGLRATPVRLALLEILGEATRALRAQEILELIRTRRRVNKVTVYRILEDFTRRGMVRKLSLEGRVNHFELACAHPAPPPLPVPDLPGGPVPGTGGPQPDVDGVAGTRGQSRRPYRYQSARTLPQMPGYFLK